MEQLTFEVTSGKWAALERMKRITLSLKVTDRKGNLRTLEAHFYDAPDNSACENLSIYACQASDAQHSPRTKPPSSSIGRLLGIAPFHKNKAASYRDPYGLETPDAIKSGALPQAKTDTTTGGVLDGHYRLTG